MYLFSLSHEMWKQTLYQEIPFLILLIAQHLFALTISASSCPLCFLVRSFSKGTKWCKLQDTRSIMSVRCHFIYQTGTMIWYNLAWQLSFHLRMMPWNLNVIKKLVGAASQTACKVGAMAWRRQNEGDRATMPFNRAGKPSLLGCPISLMLANTFTFSVCIVISPAIYSRLRVVRWCLSPSGVCAGLPLLYLEDSWVCHLPQAINDDHWLIHVKWSSLKMVMLKYLQK